MDDLRNEIYDVVRTIASHKDAEWVRDRLLAAGWTKRGDASLLEDAELEALRRVAEAATPGPWQMSGVRTKLGDPKLKRAQAHIIGPDNNGIILALFDTQTGEGFMDAKFIATFDPPTVLRLLDRLESALPTQQPPSGAALDFSSWGDAQTIGESGGLDCLDRDCGWLSGFSAGCVSPFLALHAGKA